MRTRLLTALLAAVATLTFAAPAPALQKSIWGPVRGPDGESQFPLYKSMGVQTLQIAVHWERVAPNVRPEKPTDPNDPAYTNWPAEVGYAIEEGRKHDIQVVIQLVGTPPWANGGKDRSWAPTNPRDFANFVTAAARKYPTVRHWMIWGEPSRRAQFQPLPRQRPTGPRLYSRLLDAAYLRLKKQTRRNLVIGGNTFTFGDVTPRNFIRYMRLPSGRPPRLDLYGHNPLSARWPDLRQGLSDRGRYGFADFSDLDHLAGWIDRYLVRRGRNRHKPKLFLSEYYLPTEHENHEYNFYVSRRTQANYLRAALKLSRSYRRIHTFAWLGLYDDGTLPDEKQQHPTGAHHLEVHRGLILWTGKKKPAFYVYRKY